MPRYPNRHRLLAQAVIPNQHGVGVTWKVIANRPSKRFWAVGVLDGWKMGEASTTSQARAAEWRAKVENGVTPL